MRACACARAVAIEVIRKSRRRKPLEEEEEERRVAGDIPRRPALLRPPSADDATLEGVEDPIPEESSQQRKICACLNSFILGVDFLQFEDVFKLLASFQLYLSQGKIKKGF